MSASNSWNQSLRLLILGSALLVGGAEDCGGSSPPLSVGDGDAGTPFDASSTDAGVVDSGLPDAAAVDMAPVDMAPVTGFDVVSIGNTDNDYKMVLKFDADDNAYIAHYGEVGLPYLTYQHEGSWVSYELPDITTSDFIGCDVLPDFAFDASGVLHYAYRRPDITGTCSAQGEVRYVRIVDGAVVGSPVVLGRATPGTLDPFIDVDASGVAHIAYTSSEGNLTYQTVTAGIASEPIAIPGVTAARPWKVLVDSMSHVHIVYTDEAGHLGVASSNGTGFDAPLLTASAEFSFASAAIDDGDRVHIAADGDSGYEYFTLPLGGALTDIGGIPNHGYSGFIAINPVTDEPGFVVARGRSNIDFSAVEGGVWTEPVTIEIPGSAEGVSPSVAFTSSGVPHVTFQGFGADDLYYASPR